ncbi:hypothetical protein Tco_1259666 [Tanacetum coccineum]
MTSGREMTPPPGFSTLTPIPSSNELPPITVPTFIARTPENTPLTNHASTLANPDPMISLAFVEANYEILESLLRERREHIRNKDLRTELEYFSEDYDEEREIEPRLIRIRETNPVLYTRSPRTRRQKEMMVDFENVPNRDGGRVKRNSKGGRPSGRGADNDRSQGMNLLPLLAAHLGRSKNGQSLQSSLTFMHGGPQPSINTRGNLPPNGTHLSHNAQPFIPSNLQPSNGLMPTHVNLYSQTIYECHYRAVFKLPSSCLEWQPLFWGNLHLVSQGGIEERLNQFVDQFVDRMNDMMDPKRCGDYNGRRSKDEESKNPFFKGGGSSLFVEHEEWEDDGVADDDYKESPVFDDDRYEDVIEEEEGFVDNYLHFQEDENNAGHVRAPAPLA